MLLFVVSMRPVGRQSQGRLSLSTWLLILSKTLAHPSLTADLCSLLRTNSACAMAASRSCRAYDTSHSQNIQARIGFVWLIFPHKPYATSSWTACHGYRHALTCPATVPSGGWVRVGAHRDRWCLWISPCALPNHRCHLGTCSPLRLVPLNQPEPPFRQGAGENRSHSEHSPARFGTPRRATRQSVTMRNGSFCRSCHT